MSKSTQIALRMVADAVLLLVATSTGLIASYSLQTRLISLSQYFGQHLWMVGLVLAICLPIFFVAGFYTKGRAYSSHYKPVFVAQISLLGFLIWGVALFLIEKQAGSARTSLITTAIVGTVLLAGARIWSRVWTKMNTPTPGQAPSAGGTSMLSRPGSVAVIGGAGYIGSGVLVRLLESGYRVRLVDSFMFGESPIAKVMGHPNLEIINADFRQVDVIVQALRGMDAVVHLGAIVGDPACALDEDFTIEVNLLATRMIAECAKGFGIQKFIFASTCSVYGASDEILNERSHLNPVSLYARSKIACERILHELETEKFKPTILRFGTVYGLSGRTRFDLVVNLLTAKAIVDRKITVFGADQWRPFVHVDDASLSVITALEAPIEVVGGETYNVGAEEGNLTLGDVGRIIKRLVPEAELIESGSDGDRRNYRVDFSKIRKQLGFKPNWTVEKGVQQVIEAFASGAVKDYHDSRYSNVKHLSESAQQGGLRTDLQRMRELVEDPLDPQIEYDPTSAVVSVSQVAVPSN